CTTATIINDYTNTDTLDGAVLPLGDTVVTWTVDDGNGQTATCQVTITVEDNEAPTITCAADGTRDTDAGVCEYTVQGTEFDATFSDNCTTATVTNDYNNADTLDGAVLPLGDTVVTWTVDDGNGQTLTCQVTITVEDNEAPTITCAADGTRDTDAGVCEYTVQGNEFDPSFSDNCTTATVTNDYNNADTLDGAVLPLGDTVVTWTVDDGNGQTATCQVTITVEDNEAPTITCAADDTRDTDAGTCEYTIQGNEFDPVGFGDNCTSSFITNNLNGTDTIAGEVLPVGDTTVIWTVDDGNGQTSSCEVIITVVDTIAPAISCPTDVTTDNDPGECSAIVVFSDAIASDNCGTVTVTQTDGLPSGSAFPVGINTVEFTATDASGNTTVCSFTITVMDNEPPVVVCQDITIQLDDNGTATITAVDVTGVSADNCGVAVSSIDIDTFDCSNIGPNDVTLTVTDAAGNSATCIAVVTVEDVTPPEVICQDIIVELDDSGVVTISPIDVIANVNDICGIDSAVLDIDTFDCSHIGDNVVTVTVSDTSGNEATCTATVTVVDIVDPVITCTDITVSLDENGLATITPDDVATFDDNCGVNTTAIDIFEFTCDDIGTPITVQVFVEDTSGNIASCTAVVTVVDDLAPVITCPADQTVDPGPGNLFYEIPDYITIGEATAIDNCTDPVTITIQDPAPGTLVPDGTYTITISGTDDSGNTGTCTFELTVESTLGLEDLQADLSTIVVYPNPATNVVFISNPQHIPLDEVTLFDLTGRKVATYDLRNGGQESAIDISNLASASYTMVIQGNGKQLNKRLIKE
ncbi:HYR domain-containing protein, partial [Aureisphaera sp.]